MIAIQVLAAWLLADLISGFVHWFEDRCLLRPQRVGFLETLRLDNDLHHDRPGAMLKFSIWENMKFSAAVAWPLAFGSWLAGAPLFIWLAFFFASFANVIHRFAHTAPGRLPGVVTFLQRTGIFISPEHHYQHHYLAGYAIEKHLTAGGYCVMTSWLNPIIDAVRLFR